MACRCQCKGDIETIAKMIDWNKQDRESCPNNVCWACAIKHNPEILKKEFPDVDTDTVNITLSCERCVGCPGYKETGKCILCKIKISNQ